MTAFRRSLAALVLAALVPILLFVAFQIVYATRDERRNIEASAVGWAQETVAQVDSRLRGDIRVLEALSSSEYLDDGRLAEFYDQARRVNDLMNGWLTVTLIDPQTDQHVLRLAEPFGSPPTPVSEPESYARVKATTLPVIGGAHVESDGKGGERVVIPVRVPVMRRSELRYVLSAGLDPRVFQTLLRPYLLPGGVGALIDARGMLLARTLDHEALLGQPASEFERAAVARGESRGIYRGQTFEGMESVAGFARSPDSGWSAHIALSASLIDAPRSRSVLGAALGGLAAIALAGLLLFLVLRDMNQRRQAEEVIHQMQRLEALGRMTGGLAHDFNNLLAIIVGNVAMLRRRAKNDDLPPQIAAIGQAADRGAKLIQQLLAYSRRQPLTPRVVDLNESLGDMEGLIRQSLRDDIALSMDLQADLWLVEVDPVQLETAMLNLSVNARDAMPRGGALRIVTRNVPSLRYGPSERVSVAVVDSGDGIPPDILNRVFDPFFTTKPVGEGTGLGLSMVYGFAQQSGGTVEIDSAPGRGTAVTLLFPRSMAARQPAEGAAEVQLPAQSGSGRILVIEDNVEVGALASEWLQELGYEVRCIDNAHRALSLLDGAFVPDLVFSDLVMPGGMTGVEFAREVRRRHPDLPVILTTGYADSLKDVEPDEFRILLKPYPMEALAEAIRAALARSNRMPEPKPASPAGSA